jgi:hypothetical protein
MRPNIGALAKSVDGIAPTISTGARTGLAIDRKGYDSCILHASHPQLSSTNETEISLQTSADGATGWTAVDNSTLTLSATAKSGELDINLLPCERYIRVVATVFAEANSVFASTVVLGGSRTVAV